jgi:hypothetical protein
VLGNDGERRQEEKSVGVLLGFSATDAAPENDKSRNFLSLLRDE